MKVFFVFGALLLFSVVAGCGKRYESSEFGVLSVIGRDNRVRVDSNSKDAALLGGIYFKSHLVCSGFVTGEGEITAASHCVPDGETIRDFAFQNLKGKRFAIAGKKALPFYAYDVARYQVEGRFEGKFELGEFDQNKETTLLAWSQGHVGFTRSLIGSVSYSEREGIVQHTFDTQPGASGGALVQNGKVVAVHIGSSGDRSKNIASLVLVQGSSSFRIDDLIPEWNCDSSCKWYQPDCHAWKETNCRNAEITICGRNLSVPILLYAGCQVALGVIPGSCTAGAVITAGTACAASVGTAAAVCGVSVDAVWGLGKACAAL